MPSKSATRASGFLNPSDDLSFSGAAVVTQQKTSALKQTTQTESFQSLAGSQDPSDFTHAGLLADPGLEASGLDLLTPLESPVGITSSESAENAAPETTSQDSEATTDAANPDGTGGETDADGADATAALFEDCDTSVSQIYCVYQVQEGDTLSSIADRFGLTSTENFANWELLVRSNNSVVVDPDAVAPGLKLIVPRENGVVHTVLTAETLSEISGQYGVTVEDILAVPGNGISDPNAIGIGTEILVPNPEQFAPAFVPDETVAPEDDTSAPSDSTDGGATDDTSGGGDQPAQSAPVSSSGLAWPIGGSISSYYGPSHPLGIDIDLFGRGGEGIGAAMGGVVTFAGGNACCSYGYYVVIDHGNGFQTLYGHLSSINVSVGEVVGQGQIIGGAGSTGYSTGVHLHLEVQLNGSRVNPLNYLP